MEQAQSNKEPSLFAVAKLLETGLNNLHRARVLWKPLTAHLLEVCQHPHSKMREWGAEAVTSLVRSALTHDHNPPLKQDLVSHVYIASQRLFIRKSQKPLSQ